MSSIALIGCSGCERLRYTGHKGQAPPYLGRLNEFNCLRYRTDPEASHCIMQNFGMSDYFGMCANRKHIESISVLKCFANDMAS